MCQFNLVQTTNKLVSILVPVYNSEEFVIETLQSCISQTYKNIEVIVVDDGSTDKSLELVRAFASKHSQVKVYTQTNSGACRARNFAFEMCSGDYCVFLDADDIISPNYIENHISLACQIEEDSISFCKWGRFSNNINTAEFRNLEIYHQYDDAFQLLLDMWDKGCFLQTSCYMVHRKLIEISQGWNDTVLKNQDGEFFSRILMIAKHAYFVSNAKVYYRKGNYTSVSKRMNKETAASTLDTYICYKKNALNREDSIRVRNALSKNFTFFMYFYGSQFSDLKDKARSEVRSLGVGYQFNDGQKRMKTICKYINYDLFLKIRNIFSHK